MKKENLGRNIACIAIVVLLVLVIIIMAYANQNNNNEVEVQNQTNTIVNQIQEDEPKNSTIIMTPDDQTETGVRENNN